MVRRDETQRLLLMGLTREEAMAALEQRDARDAEARKQRAGRIPVYWSETLKAYVTVPDD